MSYVVIRQLVCDWPGCGVVKADLVWWEYSGEEGEGQGIWNRTTDDRDWCAKHTREEITALIERQNADEQSSEAGADELAAPDALGGPIRLPGRPDEADVRVQASAWAKVRRRYGRLRREP